MKQLKNVKLLFVLMLASTMLHAAQPKFTIIPVTDTITAVLLPSNFTETVQYQVTNQTKITRTLTMVPITGVSQTTAGAGVCPNPFTLAPQQSCLLSLVINGSQVPSTGIKNGPVICKTRGPNDSRPDPLLCSQPNPADALTISVTTVGQHAYVANQLDNTVSVCQANPVTGFLTQCAITATGLSGVEGVGLNPSGTLFYSANISSSSITVCQVNSVTGALSSCVDAGGAGFNGPDAVSFSPDGTIFYTSNVGGTVTACLVDATTGSLSACVVNGSPTFGALGNMTLNAAGTLAYVANRSGSTISICNVSGQVLSSCNDASGSLINQPEGITLSPSGEHAYIANAGDNNVVVCDIQDGTGLLANCSVTDGQFNGTGNVGFNGNGTFAYVPNELLSQVFVCNVNQTDGSLSSCQLSRGTGFVGPSGIALS